jgi:predicted PurR-regulated permease PerM
MQTPPRPDIVRATFSILFIVGLITAAAWILRPFLPGLIWATMIVVATWPLMLAVQQRLWGRRWLASTVMTIALVFAFVAPLSLALSTIVSNADEIASWAQSLRKINLPAPPAWLQQLPFVGPRAASAWRELATTGPEEVAQRLSPYAKSLATWFVSQAGNFGVMAAQFLLTVIMAAILYAHGEQAVAGVRHFCRRLAGKEGEAMVRLAGQAIRAVALGVVVTAIIQAVLGGIGLVVVGLPFATVLTAVMFVLGVAQIGPAPVLLCAVAWLYWQGDNGWATGLLVWTVFIGSIDNVVRPILIRKGADLPLLLIFAGVIGGLLAFGVVGIFVGPVVLAVGFRLLEAWVRQGGAEEQVEANEGEAGLERLDARPGKEDLAVRPSTRRPPRRR